MTSDDDDDAVQPWPDWVRWLRVEHIAWDPEKSWADRTPGERQNWEEGRVQEVQERMAAYDVLLHLHRHMLPERYGGKLRKWGRKKELYRMLDHILKTVDEAVYHHHDSHYPEG